MTIDCMGFLAVEIVSNAGVPAIKRMNHTIMITALKRQKKTEKTKREENIRSMQMLITAGYVRIICTTMSVRENGICIMSRLYAQACVLHRTVTALS